MRFLKFAVLAALMMLPVSANAGVLGSAMTFNGKEDRLSTLSPAGLATFIDNGAAGFSAGDVVYGFLVISAGTNDYLTGSPSAANFGGGNAIAMFAAELELGTGGFNLKPVTIAGQKLENLIDPVFAAAIAGKDAMVAVVSGDIGGSTLDGLINSDNTAGAGLKHFDSGRYSLDLAANTADVGSGVGFFQFAAGGGGSVGVQKGGFNVISGVGSLGSFSYLNVNAATLFSPPATTLANIGLDQTFVNTGVAALSRGWLFETQSFGVRLNAIPEPGTFAIFAGIAGLAFFRRRNNA